MVEDFKHVRYEDDASIRNAEVSSSMGVFRHCREPGDGMTLSSMSCSLALSFDSLQK